jgi:hypothetical protein
MFTNQPRKLNPRLRKRCDYSVKQDQRNGVHVVGTSNASTNACRTAKSNVMPTNATGLLQPRPPPVACSDAALLGMVMQHFVACERICKRLGCPYDLDTLQ